MTEAAAADNTGFQGGINEPRTVSMLFWIADFILTVTIPMGIVDFFAKRGTGDGQIIGALACQRAIAIVELVHGLLPALLVDTGDFPSSACVCDRACEMIRMVPSVLIRCTWNIACG